jgi:RimJ/RimL family protein N-acetyltransferase
MRLIVDEAQRVADWVATLLGIPGFVPPYAALGWEGDDGMLVGGVVLNCWTGANVEANVAWTGPVVRSVLHHVKAYVFDQQKCRRITIHTKATRLDVIDQAKRMGFQFEGVHPAYYADDDGVSLGILRQNCRW